MSPVGSRRRFVLNAFPFPATVPRMPDDSPQTPMPAPDPGPGPTGRNRTAFVTGGTGFLGLNLVEQLVADGWQVTCLHRKEADTATLASFGVALRRGDILDLDSLTRAMPEGADAVFHLAADTSLWARNNAAQMRTNIDGTRNMVAVAARRGAGRFVFTSSWSAWGPGGQRPRFKGPITEDTPKRGDRSWINYERTKYFAERQILTAIERGLDAVILNPSHIMGRYDRHNWSRMITLAVRGKLPGVPPGHGEFCHAEAVARAHVAAVDRGETGANYLLGGPTASFAEILQTIGEVAGRPVRARQVPAWLFQAVAHIGTWWGGLRGREPTVTPEAAAIVLARPHIASTRARDVLGYESPDLRTMIADCHAWLKAEGLL